MRSPSEESFGLLEKLVAFDTTSRRSNLEMVAFVEDHLKALGVRSGADPGVGFPEFYDRGAAAFGRPV